jgi:hypothetical protein
MTIFPTPLSTNELAKMNAVFTPRALDLNQFMVDQDTKVHTWIGIAKRFGGDLGVG